MKKFNSQTNPVMARSNATKPSRIFPGRHWIASLALAMTGMNGNSVQPNPIAL